MASKVDNETRYYTVHGRSNTFDEIVAAYTADFKGHLTPDELVDGCCLVFEANPYQACKARKARTLVRSFVAKVAIRAAITPGNAVQGLSAIIEAPASEPKPRSRRAAPAAPAAETEAETFTVVVPSHRGRRSDDELRIARQVATDLAKRLGQNVTVTSARGTVLARA
ncbi:MAG: hypothetical protein ACRD34_11685 [Bryobacteraceae bacterium]